MLVKKDSPSFAEVNAKESLNFQLTFLIAVIISCILIVVIIGIFLLWILGILNLVLVIIATIKAAKTRSIAIRSTCD